MVLTLKYNSKLNFIILTYPFLDYGIHEHEKLKFNEIILHVNYYKNTKKIEQEKIKINYDDLIEKKFLGNIFYIIPLNKKTISIKNISNYYKKNKDKQNTYDIEEVHFVPEIKVKKRFDIHIF